MKEVTRYGMQHLDNKLLFLVQFISFHETKLIIFMPIKGITIY